MDGSAFFLPSTYSKDGVSSTAYPFPTSSSHTTTRTKHGILHVERKDDNSNETMEEDIPDPVTLAEIKRLKEEESEMSRTMLNQVLVSQRIVEAVTSMAWAFVIGTIVLNSLGYGYTIGDNHMIRIDTLENQQFQVEMRKSMREAANERRTEHQE